MPAATRISSDFIKNVFYRALGRSKFDAARWLIENRIRHVNSDAVRYALRAAIREGDLRFLKYLFTDHSENVSLQYLEEDGKYCHMS